MKQLFTILAVASLLTACGSSSSNSTNNNDEKNKPRNRVTWEAIPSDYHPNIQEIELNTENIETLDLDLFGLRNSTDDVELVYSADLAKNKGVLRIFSVWAESAKSSSIGVASGTKNLSVSSSGQYECAIKVENGQITKLKGLCNVRLQIILPTGAEIEVYNATQLISKRFIPVSTDKFLKDLDSATWDKDKQAVIDSYIKSYEGTSKRPSLSSSQLGKVLGEFPRSEEKKDALRKLHSVVSDRENLGKMIDDQFTYFERDEARRIAGIS